MSATSGKTSDSLAAVNTSGPDAARPVSAALLATAPTPPALAITSVTTSGATGFTLSGTATDSLGVSSVSVYDGSTLLGSAAYVAATGAWSYSGALVAGVDNTFQAIATDAAGGVATATYYAFTGGGQTFAFADASGDAASLDNTGGNWDTATGSNGTVYLTGALASLVGGGNVVYLSGAGDALSLYGTNGAWDTVYGSNGFLILNGGSQASVVGGDEFVYLLGSSDQLSLYDTNGAWDTVYGSKGFITLTDALVSVVGGGEIVNLAGASGDAVSLYDTNGAWDTVYGSDGFVILNGSQTSIVGGDESVFCAYLAGNGVSLYDSNGVWDTVYATDADIGVNDSQATIYGDGNDIYFSNAPDNAVSIAADYLAINTIYGSNGHIWLRGSAGYQPTYESRASIYGGDDIVTLSNVIGSASSGDTLRLFNTNGVADTVYNAPDNINWIYLDDAQVSVVGSATPSYDSENLIVFDGGTGDAVNFYGVGALNGGRGIDDVIFDIVEGSNGLIGVNSTQVRLLDGDDDVIDCIGGASSFVEISNSAGDTVNGAGANFSLNSAQATITGAGDTAHMENSTVTATATATSETFAINPPPYQYGDDTINGFTLADSLEFSTVDFASWQALEAAHAISQSGANTEIAYGANPPVTLTNFDSTTLTAAQFKFV